MTTAEANTAYLTGRYGPTLIDIARLQEILANPEAQNALARPSAEASPGISRQMLEWAREQLRHLLFYHSLLEFSIYAGFVTERPVHAPDQDMLADVNYLSFALVKLKNDLPKRLRRHLGGRWTEHRAAAPFALDEYYRVLALVGEAFFSEDVSAVARLGSPHTENGERRAYFLSMLRDPDALVEVFRPGQPTDEADLLLATLRAMAQLEDVLRLIGDLRQSDEDAAGQLASLYALLVGPLHHSIDLFLGEAAAALEASEARLRTSPFAARTDRTLPRNFSPGELHEKTPEEKLMDAIFGQPAGKKPFKVTLKPKPLQDTAQSEPEAEA